MLRISIKTDSSKNIVLSVEGWLVGPWVEELRQQSQQAMLGAESVTLDLEKLLFVDSAGMALLRELAALNVSHINSSTFISQQLKETTI